MKTPDEDSFEASSGNVFADMGIKDPEISLIKAKLAMQINQILQAKDLRQVEAAKLLGIKQTKVSLLSRGRLKGFSTEMLLRFLNRLAINTQIVLSPAPRGRQGTTSLSVGKKPSLKRKRKPVASHG